jgi:MFS superfamily sulfate permease-like transporter
LQNWLPKSVLVLREYDRRKFLSDVIAGLTVGLVALPLEDVADMLHKSGRTFILCGAREQPARLMGQAEFEEHAGAENICPNMQAALERTRAVFPEGEELRKQFAAAAK